MSVILSALRLLPVRVRFAIARVRFAIAERFCPLVVPAIIDVALLDDESDESDVALLL